MLCTHDHAFKALLMWMLFWFENYYTFGVKERESTFSACAHVILFEESEIDWEAGRLLGTMTIRAYIS